MESLFKEEINLQLSKGSYLYNALAILEEKYDGICYLEINFSNEFVLTSGNDFFDCLCQLKEKHPDIILYCKGYKRNVYPSRMTRQMGKGLKAYEMTLGKQATREDLVGIFDFEDQDLTSSNNEQKNFYEKWLYSL
ncbi:hypothetical protein [Glaesserella sp.]|uniref:hypothetical protein n=1 Tax=Glaesserella sp. TaxID=2094731 RepID=UPI0035A165F8